MEKFIVKIAVKTVLILIIISAIIFIILNFAFPQHVATFTEGIGNYSLSVKYTSLYYDYTKDGNDLARCVDDCILSGNSKNILEYGNKLINLDDFEEICAARDEKAGGDYKQFVCGKIVAAYYDEGDFDKALQLIDERFENMTTFKLGNPLMTLCVKVTASSQGEAHASKLESYVQRLLPKLEAIPATEKEDIDNIDYFVRRLKSTLI